VLTYKSFEADFKFKSSTKSEVSSLTIGLEQLGAFLSCFFVYPLTNKYGRKYVIAASALVFVIGAVIQTIKTGSLAGWYVGRIVAGIGMGGLSIVVPMYTAEMTPKEIRGRCGSFYQWMYTWGVFAAYWIDYVGYLHPLD
jgi:MFS family permease